MPVYQLLRGVHSEGRGKSVRTYHPGDEFASERDLFEFNTPGQAPRFILMSGKVPPDTQPPSDSPISSSGESPQKSLEEMTVRELMTLAEANGVNLGDAKKKDEIIAALQG